MPWRRLRTAMIAPLLPTGNRSVGESVRRWRGYRSMSDTADEIDITKATAQRICAEPDCETVLSRYNEFDHCALHQPMVVPRMRGKVL